MEIKIKRWKLISLRYAYSRIATKERKNKKPGQQKQSLKNII